MLRPQPRPQPYTTAVVDRGAIVVTIAGAGTIERNPENGRLYASTLIADADIERVNTGQSALISVDAWPNRDLRGSVVRLQTGSAGLARAVIALDPGEPDLRAGEAAWVRIVIERRDNALRVPYAALLFQPGGTEPQPAISNADRKAFAGQALAEFIDRVKRDVAVDATQSREIDRVARELSDAAALGLGPEADPANRRERMHAMRRTLVKQLEQVIRPEQQVQFDQLVSRYVKRAGREPGQVGQVFVINDNDEIEPVAVRIGAMDGRYTELLGAPLEAGTRCADQRIQGEQGVEAQRSRVLARPALVEPSGRNEAELYSGRRFRAGPETLLDVVVDHVLEIGSHGRASQGRDLPAIHEHRRGWRLAGPRK